MPELAGVPETEKQGFTAEELDAARIQARKLMVNDPAVSGASQAMIVARRAHGVAHLVLKRAVAAAGGNEACTEAITQAMAELAGKPFDLQDLIRQTTDLMLPLMLAENATLVETDQKVQQEVVKSAEDVRRSLPINAGFRWNADDRYFPRTKSLVLPGHPRAIELAVHKLLAAQEADKRTVLYLKGTPVTREVTNTRDKPLVTVGLREWRHVAKNQSQLDRYLAGWCAFARGVKFDLIVIESLSSLLKPMFEGSEPIGSVPRALAMLRKTCDQLGAGLVCFESNDKLVFDGEPARIWDEVRKHAELVPLHFLTALGTESETHYRWKAGEDGDQETVLKETVPRLQEK